MASDITDKNIEAVVMFAVIGPVPITSRGFCRLIKAGHGIGFCRDHIRDKGFLYSFCGFVHGLPFYRSDSFLFEYFLPFTGKRYRAGKDKREGNVEPVEIEIVVGKGK